MNKLKLLGPFIQTRWFSHFFSRKQLERYQNRQLQKQYRYMRRYSPYFSKLATSQFPAMDKQFMMMHFDELNTVGIKKEKAMKLAITSEKERNFQDSYQGVSVGLSSGTSGHRGLFITTEQEQALWAGTILAKMLPKRRLFGQRLAFFLRADNKLYQSIDSRLIRLEYFDTFKNLSDHVARLNTYQPTILIAPASMLIALAKEVSKQQLFIRPERVISVAEILEEQDRRFLKECFEVPVIHQIYQCTEGFLGCTCEYGRIHLNEDIVKIEKEYLDEHRFYPIITDFKRTSQPIINYRLNDILVEARTPCPCGSLFQGIEKIEGRSDDIFLFINQNGEPVEVYPDFIRRCLLFVEGISEYQVIQLDQNRLDIALTDAKLEQETRIRQEFQRLAQELNFICPELRFIPYSWDQTIKLKRIVRKFQKEVE